MTRVGKWPLSLQALRDLGVDFATIRRVLDREISVPEVAAAHAEALASSAGPGSGVRVVHPGAPAPPEPLTPAAALTRPRHSVERCHTAPPGCDARH
jgi:hypothetical protein